MKKGCWGEDWPPLALHRALHKHEPRLDQMPFPAVTDTHTHTHNRYSTGTYCRVTVTANWGQAHVQADTHRGFSTWGLTFYYRPHIRKHTQTHTSLLSTLPGEAIRPPAQTITPVSRVPSSMMPPSRYFKKGHDCQDSNQLQFIFIRNRDKLHLLPWNWCICWHV